MLDQMRILLLFGTRPEAIKMAPVVRCLRETAWARPVVAVTGQHREMLDQVLEIFAIHPDIDLDLMRHGQSLSELTARTLVGVTGALRALQPDLLLVQGDTTTAVVGALAAFYERVPIGHIEAGLRSYDMYDPFPEEINRHVLSVLAGQHFAPTEQAQRNLLAEGVSSDSIVVTGNTVVDALLTVSGSRRLQQLPAMPWEHPDRRFVLVTLHRRESWGEPMVAMCRSLRRALDSFPDTDVLFPMHRNPTVRQAVRCALGDHPRAHLIEPLDYISFVRAMSRCHLIVTDSGGVQEEAPVLAKPVLILRETTERPEALEAGTARLVGTQPERVFSALSELLSDRRAYDRMAHAASPFGDGHAAEQIVEAIRCWRPEPRHARELIAAGA